MAGTEASPLLDVVCQRLDTHARALSKSTDFLKLRLKLAETQAFLEEIEPGGSYINSSVVICLTALRDLAYDVDVLIDDCEQSNKHEAIFPLISFVRSSRIRKEVRRILEQLVRHLDSYQNLATGYDRANKRAISEVGFGRSDEYVVLGRDSEISDIVKSMLSNDEKIVSVVPIVGMGGIGKTTLARRIYEDGIMISHFQLRVWVSVGENLDLARIKESIAAMFSNENVLEGRQVLQKKRFLIVLDDVWDDDGEKLEELKAWLNFGDSGSCVLVTTRSSRVAALMGTVPAKHLTCLSDEDSWTLFQCLVCESTKDDDRVELEELVLKPIVSKCKGLPLAVKTIGSLLRQKSKHEWFSIKRRELWELAEFESHVLQVLKLSYDHLPSYLKQCFVYCLIFPKGYWINKEKLLQLWIAEGFVRLQGGNKGLEDVANDYFDKLYLNSFFDDVERDDFGQVVWCKMHDCMHDLARFLVVGVESSLITPSIRYSSNVRGRVQHCSLASNYRPTTPKLGKLRTLLFLSGKLENVSSLFQLSSSLRVLILSQSGMSELPVTVGFLKHLRYLDLSHTYIRKLPGSISKLKQLQTLELSNCYNLEELPKAITKLTKLRNLGIESCCSLIHIPSGIGKLRLLRKLPAFILSKRPNSANLGELNLLKNLGGRLDIKNLENVNTVVDTEEATLHEKVDIHSLELSWSSNAHLRLEMSAQVIETLRPPPNLKLLCIKGYRGSNFPLWMNLGLQNMVKFSLIDCGCKELPPLGELPNLKELLLKGMSQVLSIGYEFYGNDVVRGFPSLQQLEIYDMQNLVEWKSFTLEEKDGLTGIQKQFPCLKNLIVEGCSMLTVLPFVPNLKNLALSNSNPKLLSSLYCLPSLPSFVIDNFQEVECLTDDTGNSNSIVKLTIHETDSLEILFEALRSYSSLRHLSIINCDKLSALPMNLRLFSLLQKLDIVDCPSLVHIPDTLNQLSSLMEVKIDSCPILTLSPESIRFVSCLQTLVINRCPALERQMETETETETGEDLSKISHIPTREILLLCLDLLRSQQFLHG